MSVGILTMCCIIYRLEMFVIEVYYSFLRVAVLKNRSLLQTMVVVPEHMLHTLPTLLYRVKTLLTILLLCNNLIM